MAEILKTPMFANPGEEAAWWDANQTTVEALLTKAAGDGTLKRGTLANRGSTPTTTIRLAAEDVALAKEQAAEHGLRYQTYLKMVLHRALRKNVAGSARS